MAEVFPNPNPAPEDEPQAGETASMPAPEATGDATWVQPPVKEDISNAGEPETVISPPGPAEPAEEATWVQPTVMASEPGAGEPETVINPPGRSEPAEEANWAQPTGMAASEPGAWEPETVISPPGPPEPSAGSAADFGMSGFSEAVSETVREAEPTGVYSEPIPEPAAAIPAAAAAGAYQAPRAAPQAGAYANPALSQQDERTWAMLAHLSVLLNLVTGFLGPVAAIIIYAMYRDRSRFVAYHAMQSFVFQLLAWVGAGILAAVAWTVSGILAAILIGCLLMPVALLISLVPLAALVYGVVGAIQVNNGQDFRYWLVGDWTRSTLTG